MSSEPQTAVRLTRVLVYPLKGAAGFDLQDTALDRFGIPGDRRWMLAKPDGGFISQRTHPRLSLIRTAPGGVGDGPGKGTVGSENAGSVESRSGIQEGFRFSVEAPGMGPFQLIQAPSDKWVRVNVHRDTFAAQAGHDEADRWFSEFLGEACQLVFMPGEVERPVDPEYAPGHRVGLADGYPLHLTSEESLAEMNRVLPEKTDVVRYRPNLVVSGGAPWEEDEWRVLETGGLRLELVKPCARCAVVTVDQDTGVRGQEPLLSLRGFRTWNGKIFFGQNAVFSGTGRFRVGEDVRILERGERRPPL
jgi:uncharacterized protein YcbX